MNPLLAEASGPLWRLQTDSRTCVKALWVPNWQSTQTSCLSIT